MKHSMSGHIRGKAHRAFTILITALLFAIAVKWAWNSAGVDLLSLPEASFAEIASIIVAFITGLAMIAAIFGGRKQDDQ